MTLFDETEVRKVYRAAIKQASGFPGPEYQLWENRNFRPPEPERGLLWVAENFTILSEIKSSIQCIEATGTYQLLIYTGVGGGTEDADELVKAVAETLEGGQSLTSSAVTVILERVERTPFRLNLNYPGWVFKTVTSQWRVFTPSST